jgi:hypothetical protein
MFSHANALETPCPHEFNVSFAFVFKASPLFSPPRNLKNRVIRKFQPTQASWLSFSEIFCLMKGEST